MLQVNSKASGRLDWSSSDMLILIIFSMISIVFYCWLKTLIVPVEEYYQSRSILIWRYVSLEILEYSF